MNYQTKCDVVARSLMAEPCESCDADFKRVRNPDSDMRCGSCGNSLKSRRQQRSKLEKRMDRDFDEGIIAHGKLMEEMSEEGDS